MQVTQTGSEGLKRTLKVVVAQSELGEKFTAKVDEIKDKVQVKGFRKGKVPVAHIKKIFGRSLMSEIVQETIRETSAKAISERKERAAQFPDIKLVDPDAGMEPVLDGRADLAYEMSFEVLPVIKITNLEALKLERLAADPDEEAIEKALTEITERHTRYEEEEGRVASEGDRVTIDYDGRVDGEPFEGGKGDGLSLVLGNANFIPGFEDGLKGAKAGEKRDVKGTFPENYPVPALAGKDAVFTVGIQKVEKPVKPVADEEFAKSLGLEGLDKLKEVVSTQIKAELDLAARSKIKRELLDLLEKEHGFELPPSLVEREFEGIWRQVERQAQAEGKPFVEEGKTEAEVRSEYRAIAERRVRLGLVVGEIGSQNKIEVTQDELRRALMEQARRFPGQEKMVYEFYERTPGALQELRAPIFEDKVVDYILSVAKPVEKKVTRQELIKRVEEVTQS
jgi:trigger factor